MLWISYLAYAVAAGGISLAHVEGSGALRAYIANGKQAPAVTPLENFADVASFVFQLVRKICCPTILLIYFKFLRYFLCT